LKTSSTAAPDAELAGRLAAKRSEQDFRALYQRHAPALYAFALRLSAGIPPDAEDIVQEAWIRVLQRIGSFQGASSFRTWLFGIAVNCARELRRARGREEFSSDEPLTPHVSADLEFLIARLPEACREVLVLHDIEGYTHEEIGRMLAIAEGTSKHHLFRARQKLREWLGSER